MVKSAYARMACALEAPNWERADIHLPASNSYVDCYNFVAVCLAHLDILCMSDDVLFASVAVYSFSSVTRKDEHLPRCLY